MATGIAIASGMRPCAGADQEGCTATAALERAFQSLAVIGDANLRRSRDRVK